MKTEKTKRTGMQTFSHMNANNKTNMTTKTHVSFIRVPRVCIHTCVASWYLKIKLRIYKNLTFKYFIAFSNFEISSFQ